MKLVPRKLSYTLPRPVGKMIDVMVIHRDDRRAGTDVETLLQEVAPEDMIGARKLSPGVLGRPMIYTLVERDVHIFPPSAYAGSLVVRYYPAAVTA